VTVAFSWGLPKLRYVSSARTKLTAIHARRHVNEGFVRRVSLIQRNGIAYDAAGDRLFVTGKLWPKLFEIKFVPRSPQSRPSGAP
jgi:Glutamine cyclotransferase